MRMRYVGKDGSMGFRTGVVYDLKLSLDARWPDGVVVTAPNPATDGAVRVPYSSWENFFTYWWQPIIPMIPGIPAAPPPPPPPPADVVEPTVSPTV